MHCFSGYNVCQDDSVLLQTSAHQHTPLLAVFSTFLALFVRMMVYNCRPQQLFPVVLIGGLRAAENNTDVWARVEN